MKDGCFIVWLPYCHRSDTLAEALGFDIRFINPFPRSWKIVYPLRYLVAAVVTIHICLRYRARAIAVMNMPVFLPLTVMAVRRLFGIKVLIDNHCSIYRFRKWSWAVGLNDWLLRHADAVVVHNQTDEARHAGMVPNLFLIPAVVTSMQLHDNTAEAEAASPGLVYISTYSYDDPVAAFMDAAATLPDVAFVMTGAAPESLRRSAPSNITFTGYLDRSDYVAMLDASRGLITLTTEADAMQMGVEEAVCFQKPCLTSSSPVLRMVLQDAGVFCANDAASIAEGIRILLRDRDALSRRIGVRAGRLCREVEAKMERVGHCLGTRPPDWARSPLGSA